MDKNSKSSNDNDLNVIFKDEKIKTNKVTEGKATVHLTNDQNTFQAFYNPAQEFNRDISITSINSFMKFKKFQPKKMNVDQHKFKICEPLSATGLRSIRYFLELNNDKIDEIVAGDMDKDAAALIEKNLLINNIQTSDSKFKINCSEASELLYSKMKYFDVIDLDPYGTAVPLIDSAIQSLRNGGLLCVTFTDMSVLCGNYPETSYYKYGCIPYKTSFCHEMAKRIALFTISNIASKYKRVIKPILSINADFYIRLFMIVVDSAEDSKHNCLKHGYLFHCRSCQNHTISPIALLKYKDSNDKKGTFKFNTNIPDKRICEVCDSNLCTSGPYWIDSIQDQDFIDSIIEDLHNETKHLKYQKMIEAFLYGIKEELPFQSQVFNYDLSKFAKDTNLKSPKLSLIRGGLDSLGYKFVQSYYDPNLIKTDCPITKMYQVFKAYKKVHYEKNYFQNVKENTYVHKILSKSVDIEPKFYELENIRNVPKYLPNPFPYWGPQAKSKLNKYFYSTFNKILKKF